MVEGVVFVEKMVHNHSPNPDFEKIAASTGFQRLMAAKKRFIVPLTVFFLVFYFALPVLTSYSKVLNQPFAGDITWAWVFAFLQFIMTWVLCTMYVNKAVFFDRMAQKVLDEHAQKGEKAI
ncbi:DUF485 domain-containing protein [Heyndrickxia acidiproducens]|uniref:DUF485 domain-containing protein n=1 Tax=Heyndrickxia acidiproducens TaxID=1121084 RepID=UPI000377F2B6|nr:DUF485 domain-containing protein [Heyndrickxia acidiproducens]